MTSMTEPAVDEYQQAETDRPPLAIHLRALVPTRHAGMIIGKSGKNVQDIKMATDATVRLSEFVPMHMERVLTVVGVPEAVGGALRMVIESLAAENQQQMEVDTNAGSVLRVLVPNSIMGAVIGKGGAVIQHIQSTSQCRITASETMLPHSTDREVTLFGTAASIGLAGRAIAQIMQQQALANEGTSGRGPRHGVNVPYTPGRRNVRSAGAPDGGRRVAVNGNGNMFHGDGATFSQEHQAQPMYDGFYAAEGQPLPPQPLSSTAHTQEETSQTVYIPNDMVGAIIGRGGSKINDIRLKSGAQVRIEDAPVGNDMLEREVTVSGTPAAIKIALFLLHRRMENERKKHAMATSGNSDSAMRNESAGSSSMPTRDPSPMDNSLV